MVGIGRSFGEAQSVAPGAAGDSRVPDNTEFRFRETRPDAAWPLTRRSQMVVKRP